MDAAFGIEGAMRERGFDGFGRAPRVEADAAVAGTLRRREVRVPAARRDDGVPVRLFDARLRPAAAAAEPGTVLGLEDGRLAIAARGGVLAIGKLRIGEGAKIPAAQAADAGVEAGARLR